MRNHLLRLWVFAGIIALLAAGCAGAPASTPATGLSSTSPSSSSVTSAPTFASPTQAATAAQPTAASTEATTANASSTTAPATASGNAALPAAGALKFVIVPDQSSADYRVREQLARENLPNDAVGKTNAISGTLVIQPDGTIDAASSKFTVDLSSLQTDRSMRDNFVRRNILQTDQYPQATFVPKQATGLPNPLPQSGNVTFQLTGDLTIRDVTKPVTWDVTGQLQNGQLQTQATTTITFEDFNLQQPRVPVVLSVEDKIVLELALVFQQAQ